MGFKRLVGVFVLLTVQISTANVSSYLQEQTTLNLKYQEAQNLLSNLGFQNYVAKIQKTVKENNEIPDVSRLALKKNVSLLETFNAARDIASWFYLSVTRFNLTPTEINAIEQMLIQQIKPFPMVHFEPMPLKNQLELKMLGVAEALEKKREYASQRALERFLTEKNNLRVLFLVLSRHMPNFEVIKPQLSQWLDEKIATALQDAYQHETRQQNRILGHALLLSYVGFSRSYNWPQLEQALKIKMRAENLFLENYTQAYYVHEVAENDLRGYSIKNGDIALEYYHGQESYFTSLVIEPSQNANSDLMDRYRLQTSLLNAVTFRETNRYYSVLDKRESYQKLSTQDQDVYKNFWNQNYAKGFSHSGITQVLHDRKTGLKMAWIWDSYPERDKVGPIRIMTVQGFAYPERMMRLGFLRYSPDLLLKSYKQQMQKRGFLKTVWDGNGSFVGQTADGQWVPNQDEDVKFSWSSHLDQSKALEWMSVSTDLADIWFEKELMPRVFNTIESYLVGPNATLFADGFSNGRNLLYCSQMIVMAFLQAGQLDLQETPDQIWKLITYFSDEVKSALKLSLGQRIISPNGLVWQKNIFQNLYQLPLKNSTTELQMKKQNPTWAAEYTHRLSPVIKDLLKSMDSSWQDAKPLKEIKLKKEDVVFDVET